MRLHRKHGMNATVMICFACGESKGVALLGAAYKGEAPREMIMDYEPCDACKEKMNNGYVLIIEAAESPQQQSQPEFQKGWWPTGRTLFAKDQFFINNISPKETVEAILEKRVVLFPVDMYSQLIKQVKEVEDNEKTE